MNHYNDDDVKIYVDEREDEDGRLDSQANHDSMVCACDLSNIIKKRLSVGTKVKLVGGSIDSISHLKHRTNFVIGAIGVIEAIGSGSGYYVRIQRQLAHVCDHEVAVCNRSIYIAIGHLVQDLRAAHAAGIRAMKLASKLAKKWRARVFSQMNRIRAELKRYEAQIQDGFTVITYSGCIVGKYKNSK